MAIVRVIRFHVDNMRLPAGELAFLLSIGPPSQVVAIDVLPSTAVSDCNRLRATGQGIWFVGSSVSCIIVGREVYSCDRPSGPR